MLWCVLGALVYTCWVLYPKPVTPRHHITWSLAVVRIARDSNHLDGIGVYAATADGVYVPYESIDFRVDAGGTVSIPFGDNHLTWVKKTVCCGPAPIIALAANADGLLAAGTLDGVVHVSQDRGDHWSSQKVSDFPVSSVVVLRRGERIVVATFGDGLFARVGDASWQRMEMGAADKNIWCLLSDESRHYLLAITPSGAFSSRDDGKDWRQVSAPGSVTSCTDDHRGRLFVTHPENRALSVFRFGNGSQSLLACDGRLACVNVLV